MRSTLETRFGLDALDIYGLSEVMGPGVACEALDSKGGATLWEDHFFPEIIDPDTGAVLPEGSSGELVLTSLAKEALPVIRYRTRDLTRLLPPASPLPLRRMARISARTDDMLIIRGVNVFPTQIEELVLATEGCAAHFQIEVTRTGNLDEVLVKVECNSAIASDRSSRDSAARALAERVKAYVGISVSVTVMDPDSIERSTGKASRVFDRRAAPR
jgi:phenylacetate-CoA ligase